MSENSNKGLSIIFSMLLMPELVNKSKEDLVECVDVLKSAGKINNDQYKQSIEFIDNIQELKKGLKDNKMNELKSREGMDKLILEQQKLKYKVLQPSYKWTDRCNELNKENTQLKKQVNEMLKILKRLDEHFKWVDFDDSNYVDYELWEDVKEILK